MCVTCLLTLRQKHKGSMQHYPYCTKSSNGNKLISREELWLTCLKPITLFNCSVGYLKVLTSTCIILKMSMHLCTVKIGKEAVWLALLRVLRYQCSMSVSFSHWLTLGEQYSPQVTSQNWRAWCMPKLSVTLKHFLKGFLYYDLL